MPHSFEPRRTRRWLVSLSVNDPTVIRSRGSSSCPTLILLCAIRRATTNLLKEKTTLSRQTRKSSRRGKTIRRTRRRSGVGTCFQRLSAQRRSRHYLTLPVTQSQRVFPAGFCLASDVVFGAWLAVLVIRRRQPPVRG